MFLTIAVTMDYALVLGDPALLAITVPHAEGQIVHDSTLTVRDATLRWIEGDQGSRVWAIPDGARLQLEYLARVEVTRRAAPLTLCPATVMHDLPAEALACLRPSVYCPSDRFEPFARAEFGHLEGGAMIAAMRDWGARNMRYVPGASHAGTTALDSFLTRQGGCRDYAHLLCALARAGGVPARYVSGYGPDVSPADFHACVEVWLDGGWHLVDPTGMSTPGSFALIAAGRDAGDVAFMETAGWASVVWQEVRVSPWE